MDRDDATELYPLLFRASNDAQYVLDLEAQRFVDVNPSFEALTGYVREELVAPDFSFLRIIAPESMPAVEARREEPPGPRERYEIRILTKNGTVKPVEVSVCRLTAGGRRLTVGSLKDLTELKKLQRDTWQKITELSLQGNRIFALTERIRQVPGLISDLLNLQLPQEVMRRAAEVMCRRDGLGYERVRFFLESEGALEMAFSSDGSRARKIPLDGSHAWGDVFLEPANPILEARRAVLPLKGREKPLGLLEIQFHAKQIESLKGNKDALEGYYGLSVTLAGALGIILENLRLTETLQRQAILDQLTGTFNRRHMCAKLAEELLRCARYERDFSVLMVDVDHFKRINDTLGHRQGDAVLQSLGRMLQMMTREVDAVCRYGGDEFAILLPETGTEGARAKGEALRLAVGGMDFAAADGQGPPVRVTVSVGVAGYRKGTRTAEEILQRADEALYDAKHAGRDRVVVSAAKVAVEPGS